MNTDASMLALFLAGVVAPIVTQIVKSRGGWKDRQAVWLAFGISAVLAVPVALGTGLIKTDFVLDDPLMFIEQVGAAVTMVFGLAQLIFQTFKQRSTI